MGMRIRLRIFRFSPLLIVGLGAGAILLLGLAMAVALVVSLDDFGGRFSGCELGLVNWALVRSDSNIKVEIVNGVHVLWGLGGLVGWFISNII